MSEREWGVVALIVGVVLFAVAMALGVAYSDRQEARKSMPGRHNQRGDDEAARERSQKAMVLALGRLADPRSVETIILALQSPDVEMRRSAAEAPGRLHDERALDSLVTALRDEDPGVRTLAAETLGKSGDRRAVQPLIDALQDVMRSEYARKVA